MSDETKKCNSLDTTADNEPAADLLTIAGPSTIPTDLDLDNFNNWSVSDFPRGMVAPAGTAANYYTGAWRQDRPLWDGLACTNCMLCWVSCADSAIIMEDQKVRGVNYTHCKGCGICPLECRFDALKMVPEYADHLEPEESAKAEPEITQGD